MRKPRAWFHPVFYEKEIERVARMRDNRMRAEGNGCAFREADV